jgi:glycosyltransferase involved in cell wall biosynthesis
LDAYLIIPKDVSRKVTKSFLDVEAITRIVTGTNYVEDKRRIFNSCYGVVTRQNMVSGPGGCWNNIRLANDEYKLIDNLYGITGNILYMPYTSTKAYKGKRLRVSDNQEAIFRVLENHINFLPMSFSINMYIELHKVLEIWLYLDSEIGFMEEDIFLAQDFYTTQVLIYLFPEAHNIIQVYHAQGTLGSEMGQNNENIIKFFNQMQCAHLAAVSKWIFPSKGAIRGFLRTANNAMIEKADQCSFEVAYNGYERKEKLFPDQSFVDYLTSLQGYDLLFASTTILYKNKGVERIPRILAMIKKCTGLKIHWILVGSGEMQDSVEEAIHQYLDREDYTWFKKRFDNQDNIFELFLRSDFYIMMHYVSVFDLATLQAMAYGCIPILSNVDGNLELCGYGNGLLIDPDDTNLEQTLHRLLDGLEQFAAQKEKNRNLIENKFNNRSFLESYANVFENIK